MITRVLFATGYEEVEALTVVDILRRAGVECRMVATDDRDTVTGAHKIQVAMDEKISQLEGECDMVILPGGIPGVPNLKVNDKVKKLVTAQYERGAYVAAICAGPTALGAFGILKDKKATCYPGMEDQLECAKSSEEPVVVDGNVITSRGVGTAIPFALKLVELLVDKDTADKLATGMVVGC
jgi:4-methyl-5(b-hydroxyethyl)-thiazole monophosphate biosynthesis